MIPINELVEARGPMLLAGTTGLLLTGTIALLLQRSPIHRQRLAEMTMLSVLIWAGLACVPMNRWTLPGRAPRLATPAPTDAADASPVFPGDWRPVLESLIRPAAATVRPDGPRAAPIAQLPLPQHVKPESNTRPRLRWAGVLTALAARAYLIGCAGCAVWLLTGHVLLWRVVRTAEAPPAWLEELFRRACRATRVRHARLLITTAGLRPVSCGVWRPTVLLGADDCSPERHARLHQVLLHEAAHLRQCDAWGNALFNLAMPVLYLHPLYWLIRAKASLAREMVADDIAASVTSRATYAADLLELARARCGQRATPLAAVGIFRSPSHFYRRMHMLMQRNIRLDNRCSIAWKLTSGVACAGVLGVACATLGVRTAAAQQTPTNQQVRQDQLVGEAGQAVRSAADDDQEGDDQQRQDDAKRAAEQRDAAHRAERQKMQLREQRDQLEAQLNQSRAQLEQLHAAMLQMQTQMKMQAEQARAQAEAFKNTYSAQAAGGQPRQENPDSAELRQKIHQVLLDRVRQAGVQGAESNQINDMIRRIYLDATGREPTSEDWDAARRFVQHHLSNQPTANKPGTGNKPEGSEPMGLNTAVAGLRPQLDLVALANSYADATAGILAAKQELDAAATANDPRERSAAKAKLFASEQKSHLLRSITQAALVQAQKEMNFARKRAEAGLSSPTDALDAEGRVQILSLILQSQSGENLSPAGRQ